MADDNVGTGAGLLEFLEWAGRTGQMVPSTADAWTTAVRRVLAVESEDIAAVNVSNLDVEGLLDRFHKLNRANYSEGSMSTYKSRFRNAVGAYSAWLNNEPWKPASRSTGRKRGTATNGTKAQASQPEAASPAVTEAVPTPQHGSTARLVSYNLPLRPDLMVSLSLPIDLNTQDAERISAFISSLAFAEPPTLD